MKQYKVLFQCDSRISRIPDAQTIFGAICSIYINIYGEAKFEEYIHSFETEPLFVHSSMFPESLFPMFKQPIFSIDFINEATLNNDINNVIEAFSHAKKYQSIKYISKELFEKYILNDDLTNFKRDLLMNEDKYNVNDDFLSLKEENISFSCVEKLATRVTTDPNKAKENKTFYDIDVFYPEGQCFQMYVKSNISKDELNKLFSYIQYFPLGSRGSTGKNIFKLISIDEVELRSNGSCKYLLSKCYPKENEFNYDRSSYALTRTKYRSSKAYQNILLGKLAKFTEGSLMDVNEDKEYYGKVIDLNDEEHPVYHYGIGFVF